MRAHSYRSGQAVEIRPRGGRRWRGSRPNIGYAINLDGLCGGGELTSNKAGLFEEQDVLGHDL
jgi:hypothetical protein